jgi:hypothetical protein
MEAGSGELAPTGGVENSGGKGLDVAVVESGDGVAEDDRRVTGQAGGES